MNTYAKVTPPQWEAIRSIQENFGVPDRPLSKAVGCGATTILGRRRVVGWTVRKLPEAVLTPAMAREFRDAETQVVDIFASDDQPPLDEASIRRAQERLLALIVNETARVGLGEIDPLAVKRLEVMSNMAKSVEKIMELKERLTPPQEAVDGAEKTAAVLAHMDRRVDELANRRARDIVEQCCNSGSCRADLPDTD